MTGMPHARYSKYFKGDPWVGMLGHKPTSKQVIQPRKSWRSLAAPGRSRLSRCAQFLALAGFRETFSVTDEDEEHLRGSRSLEYFNRVEDGENPMPDGKRPNIPDDELRGCNVTLLSFPVAKIVIDVKLVGIDTVGDFAGVRDGTSRELAVGLADFLGYTDHMVARSGLLPRAKPDHAGDRG